jgi:hypothetical protein
MQGGVHESVRPEAAETDSAGMLVRPEWHAALFDQVINGSILVDNDPLLQTSAVRQLGLPAT